MSDALTWTCHICHRERPDAMIAVQSKMTVFAGVPVQQNVRYCLDNDTCWKEAQTFSFFKGGPAS